jgi:hypothetical protein
LNNSLELDISIINKNNNYKTKSIATKEKSINKKMTERTYGKNVVKGMVMIMIIYEVIDVVCK